MSAPVVEALSPRHAEAVVPAIGTIVTGTGSGLSEIAMVTGYIDKESHFCARTDARMLMLAIIDGNMLPARMGTVKVEYMKPYDGLKHRPEYDVFRDRALELADQYLGKPATVQRKHNYALMVVDPDSPLLVNEALNSTHAKPTLAPAIGTKIDFEGDEAYVVAYMHRIQGESDLFFCDREYAEYLLAMSDDPRRANRIYNIPLENYLVLGTLDATDPRVKLWLERGVACRGTKATFIKKSLFSTHHLKEALNTEVLSKITYRIGDILKDGVGFKWVVVGFSKRKDPNEYNITGYLVMCERSEGQYINCLRHTVDGGWRVVGTSVGIDPEHARTLKRIGRMPQQDIRALEETAGFHIGKHVTASSLKSYYRKFDGRGIYRLEEALNPAHAKMRVPNICDGIRISENGPVSIVRWWMCDGDAEHHDIADTITSGGRFVDYMRYCKKEEAQYVTVQNGVHVALDHIVEILPAETVHELIGDRMSKAQGKTAEDVIRDCRADMDHKIARWERKLNEALDTSIGIHHRIRIGDLISVVTNEPRLQDEQLLVVGYAYDDQNNRMRVGEEGEATKLLTLWKNHAGFFRSTGSCPKLGMAKVVGRITDVHLIKRLEEISDNHLGEDCGRDFEKWYPRLDIRHCTVYPKTNLTEAVKNFGKDCPMPNIGDHVVYNDGSGTDMVVAGYCRKVFVDDDDSYYDGYESNRKFAFLRCNREDAEWVMTNDGILSQANDLRIIGQADDDYTEFLRQDHEARNTKGINEALTTKAASHYVPDIGDEVVFEAPGHQSSIPLVVCSWLRKARPEEEADYVMHNGLLRYRWTTRERAEFVLVGSTTNGHLLKVGETRVVGHDNTSYAIYLKKLMQQRLAQLREGLNPHHTKNIVPCMGQIFSNGDNYVYAVNGWYKYHPHQTGLLVPCKREEASHVGGEGGFGGLVCPLGQIEIVRNKKNRDADWVKKMQERHEMLMKSWEGNLAKMD